MVAVVKSEIGINEQRAKERVEIKRKRREMLSQSKESPKLNKTLEIYHKTRIKK